MKTSELKKYAKNVRKRIFDFKTKTGVGHLASCLSCVDILVSLYNDTRTKFDHKKDIFIFSKAHGSPAIYPILADLNYFCKEELNKYATFNGILKLHSDKSIPGCYHVGGSLGNNIGYAVGLAFANKDKNYYVLLGDAELYEGSVWESLLFISHHNLKNITLIIDRNKYGILGATEELLKLESLEKKFQSFNFKTLKCNGHDYNQLQKSFNKETEKPKIIICDTIKGKGVSYMEDKWEYHTIIPKSKEDIEKGLKELS